MVPYFYVGYGFGPKRAKCFQGITMDVLFAKLGTFANAEPQISSNQYIIAAQKQVRLSLPSPPN